MPLLLRSLRSLRSRHCPALFLLLPLSLPRFLLLILPLLALAIGPASALASEPVRIALKEEAMITGSSVRLGDVAMVSAADREMRETFEAMRIESAPRVGYVDRLSRQQIEQMLHSRLPPMGSKLEWSGAGAVMIRTAAHLADTAALAAIAQHYLIDELGRHFDGVEAELVAPLADFEVPMGVLRFRPRPVDVAHVAARQPVWIDVLVDDVVYRSVVVPFQLRLRRAVQVARRDLPEGAMVSAADFDTRTEEVSDIVQRVLPASDLRGTMRVKQRIASGEVVMRRQLAEEGTIQRGDVVKLVLADGGMRVETRAIAQQQAVLGQELKVRPDRGIDTVSGRVVAGGVVQAEAW